MPENADNWNFDRAYDGGDLACGQLLLDLRLYFRDLPEAAVVMVRSVDEGAPVEIPAWCRLMGHMLLDSAHPRYLIQKRSHPTQPTP